MFTDAEASIIESGEKTGRLNTSLLQLADQVEKVASITNKIKGALIYPAAIVIVMCLSIGVLMTLVVPKLVEMFGDKSKLPSMTQLLMNMSDFFVGYWWAMLLGFFGIVVAISFWKKTESGRYKFDGILIMLPIF
jgi:type II secretory pathway component PulF